MDPILYKNQYPRSHKVNLVSGFLKAFGKKKNSQNLQCFSSDEYDLIENIKRAKSEWVDANINFEYADDQELVDYYTYKIKACQILYDYYIKKAKQRGLKLEAANMIDIGMGSSYSE